MSTDVPAHYSWEHMGLYSSQGPSMYTVLDQIETDLDALNTRSQAMQAKLDSLITNFNNHRGSAGVHVDADTANTITSTAATTIATDILALVNDLYTQYEAHRLFTTGSVHGAQDTTNVVTATAPATTEAEAIALVNDIKAQYEAHRILTTGSVHGAADTTNTVSSGDATDWDSVVTLANELNTDYTAHRQLTAGSVHGASDDTNVITASAAGAQITALQTELNEIKADYNLHVANLGVHPMEGTSESTANASDEATAVALVNALKATINTHMASATDHLDADTLVIEASAATEYEDILTLTAEVRADYEAHRVKTAVHAKADAANAETALGTGGAVTIGLNVL